MNLIDAIIASRLSSQGSGSGSGNSNFVVTLTKSAEADGWVADKTFAATVAAFKAGRTVVFMVTIGDILYQFNDVLVETISNEDSLAARIDGIGAHPEKLFVIWSNDLIYVTGRYIRDVYGLLDQSSSSASVPGTADERTTDFEYDEELSSLTITTFQADAVWAIRFKSGSTPTQLTLPQGLIGLDDFEPKADTEYILEIAFGVGYVGVPTSDEEEKEEVT